MAMGCRTGFRLLAAPYRPQAISVFADDQVIWPGLCRKLYIRLLAVLPQEESTLDATTKAGNSHDTLIFRRWYEMPFYQPGGVYDTGSSRHAKGIAESRLPGG